jgi:hypothetical protein
MRHLTAVFAATTTVFALSTLYLGASSGTPAAQADQSTCVALKTERERLLSEQRVLEGELSSLRRELTVCSESALPGEPDTVRVDAQRPASTTQLRLPELSTENRQIQTLHRFGELFRELGLSEAEIDALVPILSRQRTPSSVPLGSALDRAPGAASAELERNRTEVGAVIGLQKAVEFETLVKQLPARSQLRALRSQLEQTGEPLSAEQQTQVLAALTHSPSERPRSGQETPEETANRMQAWRHDRDEKLRQVAAPYLSSAQMKRLEESDSLQTAYESMRSTARSLSGLNASAAAAGTAAPRPN